MTEPNRQSGEKEERIIEIEIERLRPFKEHAVLVAGIQYSDNLRSSLFGVMAYTVFMLMKVLQALKLANVKTFKD